MPEKKHSIEKREILQNTVFGTFAGLAMGGPLGAIIAGIAGLKIASIQEKIDQDKRNSISNIKINHEIYKNTYVKKTDMNDRLDAIRFIKEIMIIKRPLISNIDEYNYYTKHTDTSIIKILYDDIRNNVIGKKIVTPIDKPYVKIIVDGLEGNGVVYSEIEFAKKLKDDIDNPNFERYCFYKSKYNTLHNCIINDDSIGRTIYYMYTIDYGKNYVVCW